MSKPPDVWCGCRENELCDTHAEIAILHDTVISLAKLFRDVALVAGPNMAAELEAHPQWKKIKQNYPEAL